MRERRTPTRGELEHLLRIRKGLTGETQVILKDLDLSGMDLQDMNFKNATIDNVDFSYTQGRKADFTGASIKNSTFNRTCLKHGSWSEATIQNTTFACAELHGSDFSFSKFKDVHLLGADLSYSGFEGSRLLRVDFHNTNSRSTKWRGAILYDVSFKGSRLSGAQLRSTKGLVIREVGPVGTYCGPVTYLPADNIVIAGCWQGNEEEFYAECLEVEKKHPDSNLSLDIAQYMVKATKKDYKEGNIQ